MPGGDKRAKSRALSRGFIGSWGFWGTWYRLRGVDLLSDPWIFRINLNFLLWFLMRYLPSCSRCISNKATCPTPQDGLKYCLLKSKLRISYFLTSWVLKCNLIFKVESFLPCFFQRSSSYSVINPWSLSQKYIYLYSHSKVIKASVTSHPWQYLLLVFSDIFIIDISV